MPSDRDVGDELLEAGGWSRRTVVAIALAVLVVAVAVVVGLTGGGGHSSSAQRSAEPSAPESLSVSSPAAALTGNDVLIPGLWSRFGNDMASNNRWSVTASAELVSSTDRTLSVLYPITIAGIGNEVSVNYAEVADARNSASLAPPEPLSRIGGRSTVEVWIQLRVPCGEHRFSFRDGTISIALAGTTEPALFAFHELFGASVVRRPEPC